jgi:hypothetical protein
VHLRRDPQPAKIRQDAREPEKNTVGFNSNPVENATGRLSMFATRAARCTAPAAPAKELHVVRRPEDFIVQIGDQR